MAKSPNSFAWLDSSKKSKFNLKGLDNKKTIQWLKNLGNPYSNIPIDKKKIAFDFF